MIFKQLMDSFLIHYLGRFDKFPFNVEMHGDTYQIGEGEPEFTIQVNKDIPPYCMAARYPIAYEGVNKVGLHRRGYTSEQIDAIADVYRTIYDSGQNITQSLEAVEKLPASPERDVIMNFVRASKRGIVRKP